MAKVETVGKIKGLGTVKVCSANFYDQLVALKKAGIKYPITVRDTTYMRLHNGPIAGTRTCAAPIWYKESPLVVAKISPLVKDLDMAKLAVEANRKNKHFSTDDSSLYEQYAEIAEKDKSKSPEKRRAIFMPSDSQIKMQKGDENSQSLFEDTAVEYFNKFAPNGITFYSPNRDYTSDKNGTGVSYLWFYSPDFDSRLGGCNRNLYDDNRAFGVSRGRGHAEGVAREKLPYSTKEVNRNLEILNQIIKGEVKISDLESKLGNVASFLESLKQ